MKILIAEQDRDLLSCLEKLMTADGNDVRTCFDGARAVALIGDEKFDMAIIDEDLPRANRFDIEKMMCEKVTPYIMLLWRRATPKLLSKKAPLCSYLEFPFEPNDLISLANGVCKKEKTNNTTLNEKAVMTDE